MNGSKTQKTKPVTQQENESNSSSARLAFCIEANAVNKFVIVYFMIAPLVKGSGLMGLGTGGYSRKADAQ
jgi:hypothetical protein